MIIDLSAIIKKIILFIPEALEKQSRIVHSSWKIHFWPGSTGVACQAGVAMGTAVRKYFLKLVPREK